MKRHITGAAALALALAWPAARALEVNRASLAELEALGGVGTDLAARIVEARERRPFTDWDDLRHRVRGLGPKVAARLSEQGLTVQTAPYPPARTPAPASAAR